MKIIIKSDTKGILLTTNVGDNFSLNANDTFTYNELSYLIRSKEFVMDFLPESTENMYIKYIVYHTF